jgi:hypothetical protein
MKMFRMFPSLVPGKFPVFPIRMPKFSMFWIAVHYPYKRSTHIVHSHSTTRSMGNIRNGIDTA